MFSGDIVVYEYKNNDSENLVSEQLSVNDKTLIYYYYEYLILHHSLLLTH